MTKIFIKLLESKLYIITIVISVSLILLSLLDQIPTNGKIVFRQKFDFSSITILILGSLSLGVSAYLVYLYEFRTNETLYENKENKPFLKDDTTLEMKSILSNKVEKTDIEKKLIDDILKIYHKLSETQKVILRKIYDKRSTEVLEDLFYQKFTKDHKGLIGNKDEFHYRLKDIMSQEIKLIEVKSVGEHTSTIIKFDEIAKLLIKASIIKTDS